jgi:hypothetical protein
MRGTTADGRRERPGLLPVAPAVGCREATHCGKSGASRTQQRRTRRRAPLPLRRAGTVTATAPSTRHRTLTWTGPAVRIQHYWAGCTAALTYGRARGHGVGAARRGEAVPWPWPRRVGGRRTRCGRAPTAAWGARATRATWVSARAPSRAPRWTRSCPPTAGRTRTTRQCYIASVTACWRSGTASSSRARRRRSSWRSPRPGAAPTAPPARGAAVLSRWAPTPSCAGAPAGSTRWSPSYRCGPMPRPRPRRQLQRRCRQLQRPRRQLQRRRRRESHLACAPP